jgi:hypothetical protein
MRVDLRPPVIEIPKELEGLRTALKAVVEHLWLQTAQLNLLSQGQINFGDGESGDNVAGKWITYTTTESEDAVEHNLGVIPTGFIVFLPPDYGVINKGPTPWTTTHLYLICGEPNQEVTVFVTMPTTQSL